MKRENLYARWITSLFLFVASLQISCNTVQGNNSIDDHLPLVAPTEKKTSAVYDLIEKVTERAKTLCLYIPDKHHKEEALAILSDIIIVEDTSTGKSFFLTYSGHPTLLITKASRLGAVGKDGKKLFAGQIQMEFRNDAFKRDGHIVITINKDIIGMNPVGIPPNIDALACRLLHELIHVIQEQDVKKGIRKPTSLWNGEREAWDYELNIFLVLCPGIRDFYCTNCTSTQINLQNDKHKGVPVAMDINVYNLIVYNCCKDDWLRRMYDPKK